MQNDENGIPTPTNSDPYNLTADLAKMAKDSDVVIRVASKAARDALTKKDGRTVARLDLGGVLEVYDVDTDSWSKAGIQHAEYTGTTVPTPAASWGTGPLSLDSAMSRNGGIFVSPAPDKITLPGPGLYSVSVRVSMAAASTGKSWVAIVNDNNTVTYTSYDIQPGTSTGAASIPNFYVPATQNVRIVFYSETNAGVSGYTLTSRVRVSRIG